MSQRFDGVREANRGLGLLTPFILQKSRMRRTRSFGSVRGAIHEDRPYRDQSPEVTKSNREEVDFTGLIWQPSGVLGWRESILI